MDSIYIDCYQKLLIYDCPHNVLPLFYIQEHLHRKLTVECNMYQWAQIFDLIELHSIWQPLYFLASCTVTDLAKFNGLIALEYKFFKVRPRPCHALVQYSYISWTRLLLQAYLLTTHLPKVTQKAELTVKKTFRGKNPNLPRSNLIPGHHIYLSLQVPL